LSPSPIEGLSTPWNTRNTLDLKWLGENFDLINKEWEEGTSENLREIYENAKYEKIVGEGNNNKIIVQPANPSKVYSKRGAKIQMLIVMDDMVS